MLLGLVLAGVGYLAWRTNSVFNYRWDWSTVWPFIFRLDAQTGRWVPNILVEGFFTTIRLAVYGIVIAAVIGTLMGMARNSRRLFLRLLSGAYVMLIRNIPPVVFVFAFCESVAFLSLMVPATIILLGLGAVRRLKRRLPGAGELIPAEVRRDAHGISATATGGESVMDDVVTWIPASARMPSSASTPSTRISPRSSPMTWRNSAVCARRSW